MKLVRGLTTLALMFLTSCTNDLTVDASGGALNSRSAGPALVPRTISEPVHLRSATAENLWFQDPFIGIAMSGGGTRAAVFSAAVLEELDRLGVLDRVSAISSVSGSSLTAAYFALNGEKVRSDEDWNKFQALLSSDFVGSRAGLALKSLVLGTSRSAAIASRFNSSLFHNARFSDLGEPGPRRPLLFIDAARLGSQTPFVFAINEYDNVQAIPLPRRRFKSMAEVPIASAVMASAAVPGVLEPLAIEYEIEEQRMGYLHIYDGGVRDNLGVEELLRVMQNYAAAAMRRSQRFSGCLMIVVDSDRGYGLEEIKRIVDGRPSLAEGAASRMLNPSAWDALDSLMRQKAVVTLKRVGILGLPTERRRLERSRIPRVSMEHPSGAVWTEWFRPHTGDFPLFSGSEDLDYLNRMAAGQEGPTCKTWHISPMNLPTVGMPIATSEQISALRKSEGRDSPAVRALEQQRVKLQGAQLYRSDLRDFFGLIETDFRLVGPKNCSRDFLQERIRDMAKILVREDRDALTSICQLGASGVSKVCAPGGDVTPDLQRINLGWRSLVNLGPEKRGPVSSWSMECTTPLR